MPLTTSAQGAKPKKSVNSLLGEHSNLVNLDNLVTDSKNQGEQNHITLQPYQNNFDMHTSFESIKYGCLELHLGASKPVN